MKVFEFNGFAPCDNCGDFHEIILVKYNPATHSTECADCAAKARE
jgi:hypothetical protein